MAGITTHILDTSKGRPAIGVHVRLERETEAGVFTEIGAGATDGDGRLRTLLPSSAAFDPGVYRITFAIGAHYAQIGEKCFYPEVSVTFVVASVDEHYHVPLLISPYGFSTYRGS